jgi:hypothetical protein
LAAAALPPAAFVFPRGVRAATAVGVPRSRLAAELMPVLAEPVVLTWATAAFGGRAELGALLAAEVEELASQAPADAAVVLGL